MTPLAGAEHGELIMTLLKRSVALLSSVSLVLATAPGGFSYQTDQSVAPPPPQAAQQTPEQLQQLVAPIALYPDALVAQILAGATYPAEVVEADRWMQQHSDLKGKKLADEVNKQSWDPSVKALAQFPSVLADMDKNLSWTSSLGDAYVNQPQDVMTAVQVMRGRAQSAGNLKSTPQEQVATQGQTIMIEPVNPDVVYVPQYDPWLVYGAPLGVWPGWYPYPGLYLAGAGIAFGVGFGLGFFGGYGWGWGHWGSDWHNRTVMYNHATYISHSRTFANRNNFGHGVSGVNRAAGFRATSSSRGPSEAQHGFAATHSQAGVHSGAFSGFNHGGATMASSSRGRSSFGGGFHGGGGGSHGGGGRR
jgi:uncharacterized membrane protein YgcG